MGCFFCLCFPPWRSRAGDPCRACKPCEGSSVCGASASTAQPRLGQPLGEHPAARADVRGLWHRWRVQLSCPAYWEARTCDEGAAGEDMAAEQGQGRAVLLSSQRCWCFVPIICMLTLWYGRLCLKLCEV